MIRSHLNHLQTNQQKQKNCDLFNISPAVHFHLSDGNVKAKETRTFYNRTTVNYHLLWSRNTKVKVLTQPKTLFRICPQCDPTKSVSSSSSSSTLWYTALIALVISAPSTDGLVHSLFTAAAGRRALIQYIHPWVVCLTLSRCTNVSCLKFVVG